MVALPVYEWNLVHGTYYPKEMGPPAVHNPFIYGYFWSHAKKDRVLLGFNYKEVIERVLRDYS